MKSRFSKGKIFRIIWFSFVAVFFIWIWSAFQSRNLPEETFASNAAIAVEEDDDQISFRPQQAAENAAVIFFQGGLTDPKAYAPLCRRIAESGFTCHLIKMSLRLPVRDYKKITRMFDLKTGRYFIGGHSQGGKMAAQFVYENPQTMKGLFLLGTSHPRDIDLSGLSIPAIKLYAENDGLASVEEVLQNKKKLPKNTRLFMIRGGNHSQFGYLGKLLGDNKAAITLEAQQSVIAEHLIGFLHGAQQK